MGADQVGPERVLRGQLHAGAADQVQRVRGLLHSGDGLVEGRHDVGAGVLEADARQAGGGHVAAVLLYMGYFRGIPRELEEAAVIDGAGFLTVFFRVMLPLHDGGGAVP